MQTYIDKANGNGRTYLSKKKNKHTTCYQIPNILNFLGTAFKAYLRHYLSANLRQWKHRACIMYNGCFRRVLMKNTSNQTVNLEQLLKCTAAIVHS